MNEDKIKIIDLFDCKIEFLKKYFEDSIYPWELLPKIDKIINKFIIEGLKNFKLIENNILIGNDVKISKSSNIIGPAIICENVEIRPGAYIRGNVIIGPNCVIGNSTEIKNSILLNHVEAPHYNYIGDSILGNFAHLGAGVICSNLRLDKKNILIKGKKEYCTNLRKIGAFIGDYSQVGCNSVLNPGSILSKNTYILPLTCFKGIH